MLKHSVCVCISCEVQTYILFSSVLSLDVMNDAPCRMRGLFTEGMKEAHQVLYVAEKLIAQFNPKLSRHFDKEGVHISMFVTL